MKCNEGLKWFYLCIPSLDTNYGLIWVRHRRHRHDEVEFLSFVEATYRLVKLISDNLCHIYNME